MKFAKKALAFALALLCFCTAFVAVAEEEEVNYTVIEEPALAEGDNTCTLSTEYEYTVFTLRPERPGKFTVTADNGTIGIVSNNGMWITVDSVEESVTETSLVWDCTGVGQSVWIAVKSTEASVTLNVAWEELIIVTIPRTPYENKITPEAFTYQGSVDFLEYVDTFDDTEDTAVLDENGFYRLNSTEGPILYAKLDDGMMSLLDAYGYGQLVAVIYGQDGKAVEKIDFNEAFNAYYLCSDDGLYPLTEDLITIYKEMGRSNSWYGEDGWVGGNLGDAWMFACYYSTLIEGIGDVNGDGTIDQFDYLLVKRHYFETRYLTDEEMTFADVNNDGEVNQFDYILIKRHYFGTYVIG